MSRFPARFGHFAPLYYALQVGSGLVHGVFYHIPRECATPEQPQTLRITEPDRASVEQTAPSEARAKRVIA